jgi:hypothetical protein
MQLRLYYQPCNISSYILCWLSCALQLLLCLKLCKISLNIFCRLSCALQLLLCLQPWDMSSYILCWFFALCNCFYAFSLVHCLHTEQVLVLLSLLFSAVALSCCFCFFSAAGLAGNLVILRCATLSCLAFFFCCHIKSLLLFFHSFGTYTKPNN